jgi:hypothetical protein
MYLFIGIGIAAFFLYVGSTLLLFVQSLRRGVGRAVSRVRGLFSAEFEARECNLIAVRMAAVELKANGWDLDSAEGQNMVFVGATAHVFDAAYEYDCRWDVRLMRWIRGLPPRKRFASAVETLRDIRKEAQQRRPDAPESEQKSNASRDSEKPQ